MSTEYCLVQVSDLKLIECFDTFLIIGSNKCYVIKLEMSEYSMRSGLSEKTYLGNATKQLKKFTSIEQAFKFLEDLGFTENHTVELVRGVIKKVKRSS